MAASRPAPALFEFILLEEETDGVLLRLRHYGPAMTDREKTPIRMKMAAIDRRFGWRLCAQCIRFPLF